MKDTSGTLATVIASSRTDENGAPVTDVQVDAGVGDVTTAELYQPPGDDALPLPGDSALLQETPGSGLKACIGFADPVNQGKAAEGERRIYSRTREGRLAADIWFKGDGSVHIEVHDLEAPVFIKTPGRVVIDSPDIRLGDEESSRPIACVGDMVSGTFRALSTAPGNPIAPVPPATPSPTGGVPFTAKIISGSPRAKGK